MGDILRYLFLPVLGLEGPSFDKPYKNAAQNTKTVPINVVNESELPKMKTLITRLTSLRIFRIMVTVKAEPRDPNWFTPRMQTYWVTVLRTRCKTLMGITAFEKEDVYGLPDVNSCRACDFSWGKSGRKKGSARKC